MKLTANGTEMWVEDSGGGGSPLLCISGLGYSNWCWADLQQALSPRHRVVTFDNRGTGRSAKPPAPYSIAQMAQDAASVLDALGIAQTHVIGHSMGGYIAMHLAVHHAAKVKSLTLVSTTCGGPEGTPVPQSTLRLWIELSTLPPLESARRGMPTSFAPGWTEKHPQRFEQLLAARLQYPTPKECWAAQFAAAGQYIEKGIDVRPIAKPTLIIHGTEDRVVPYPNGQLLASRIAGAKLVTLQGCGHLPPMEEPQRLAKLVAEHLQASD
jgi:pimeloyl-ACP methyl ester carboxylesterase